MMVVIAILALFAVLVAPRMVGGLFTAQLDVAIQAVREDLEFARSRSISSGLRHQFYLDAETREVLVQAYRPEEALQQTPTGLTDDFVLRDRLPREVSVHTWTVAPMSVSEQQPAGGATNVLTLYPEGRSDDAVIILEGDDGERRGLILSGYTGELRELTPEETAGRF